MRYLISSCSNFYREARWAWPVRLSRRNFAGHRISARRSRRMALITPRLPPHPVRRISSPTTAMATKLQSTSPSVVAHLLPDSSNRFTITKASTVPPHFLSIPRRRTGVPVQMSPSTPAANSPFMSHAAMPMQQQQQGQQMNGRGVRKCFRWLRHEWNDASRTVLKSGPSLRCVLTLHILLQ